MMRFLTKHSRWLLPAVLILFILEVITLPFVMGMTWAGRSETPDHLLLYVDERLQWQPSKYVDANGVFRLSLFDSTYGGVVESENGDRVVAPGTEGDCIVRFFNQGDGSIGYTAVFYAIRTDENLPVVPTLSGHTFRDTQTYRLPEGVSEEQVLRAVGGWIDPGGYQDFDMAWRWEFETDDAQNALDTWLANQNGEDTDSVTVGLYIVVEDPSIVLPEPPVTGDDSLVGMYLVLMAISGVLLILMLIGKRREKKCGG